MYEAAAVHQTDDLDKRLQKSAQKLRAWRWMSRITNDPEEVAAQLTIEARVLIELGRENPARARDIGKLIVAYHNLIVRMKRAAGAGPCEHVKASAVA